jgi:hypothetical protein
MTLYSQSVLKPQPDRLQTGVLPAYMFGSLDPHADPLVFAITAIAQSTTTVTATVALKSGGAGAMPSVGQIIGVRGTTAGSGAANTAYAAITNTTVDSGTGIGTISYTVTTSQTVVSTEDVGELKALPFETPDSVVSGSASKPFALAFTPDEADNSRCVYCECSFPTLPTSCTIVLQAANVDDDTRYADVLNAAGTNVLASVAAGAVTQAGSEYQFIMAKFLRMKVKSASGAFTLVGTMFA